jgi:hypothetical protein
MEAFDYAWRSACNVRMQDLEVIPNSVDKVSCRVGANRLTDACGFAEFGVEGIRRPAFRPRLKPSSGGVITDATRPLALSSGTAVILGRY